MNHAVNLNSSHSLSDAQIASLQLFFVVNSAARAYWKLIDHFGGAATALQATDEDWSAKGVHANHVKNFNQFRAQDAALTKDIDSCLTALENGHYGAVFVDDTHYPKQLDVLHDKPPVLFLRGDKHALNQAQVAMVGTRKPSQAARDICERFAQHFATEGLWVTSGLADGIDRHAHIGALKQQQGRTVAVLGNGITSCYPRSNQKLYDAIVSEGGAVISEFLPAAKPMAHHFPRRNRVVSGLSLATVVVEAAQKSGSLITASFAAEQGKTVFAIPGHIYNAQAKGCHQLIREGAILVDEPAQVIEDINLPRRIHVAEQHGMTTPVPDAPSGDLFSQPPVEQTDQTSVCSQLDVSPTHDMPAHLDQLLNQLDWVGQDMDRLISQTGLSIAELSSQLMELELMGLAVQQGGLYLRCRP